jgi:hypothetical protein
MVLLVITFLQLRPAPSPQAAIQATLTPVPLSSYMGPKLKMTVLDIQAIRLREPSTNKAFTISRGTDGQWTAPNSTGKLDPDAASKIAKATVVMQIGSSVSLIEGTKLDQYGFKPNGQLSVEILLRNNQTHIILIGGLSPSQDNFYALVDEEAQVYLLERGAVDYLMVQLKKPPLT